MNKAITLLPLLPLSVYVYTYSIRPRLISRKSEEIIARLSQLSSLNDEQVEEYRANTPCSLCREIFLCKGPCRGLGWKVVSCMSKRKKEETEESKCLDEISEFNTCFTSNLTEILQRNPSLMEIIKKIEKEKTK